jgi:hypothetical protein
MKLLGHLERIKKTGKHNELTCFGIIDVQVRISLLIYSE